MWEFRSVGPHSCCEEIVIILLSGKDIADRCPLLLLLRLGPLSDEAIRG